ncbi:MAG: hypothetical protein Q7S10_03450 [bacterium]|nr:hypothetical protein [bacterium]
MPTIVITFGLVFLLQAWGLLEPVAVSIAWPFIIILAGVVKLIEKSGMCDCC